MASVRGCRAPRAVMGCVGGVGNVGNELKGQETLVSRSVTTRGKLVQPTQQQVPEMSSQ